MGNVSYLIKTRMYNCGFPEKFQYYPAGMDLQSLEYVHKMALEVMNDPREIAAGDHLRRCVIVQGKYLILGIGGFLADFMTEERENFNNFCDFSQTRMVYGFVAFVWDQENAEGLPLHFPDLQSYSDLVRKTLLPFWEISDNSLQAEKLKRGIPVTFDYTVETSSGMDIRELTGLPINEAKEKVEILYSESLQPILTTAIKYAREGHVFSLCTGGGKEKEEELANGVQTLFDNWLVDDPRNVMTIIEKRPPGGRSKGDAGTANRKEHTNVSPGPALRPDDRKQRPFRKSSTGYKWIEFRFMIKWAEIPVEELISFASDICGAAGGREFQEPCIYRHELQILILAPTGKDINVLVEDVGNAILDKHSSGCFPWLILDKFTCESDFSGQGTIFDYIAGKIIERLIPYSERKTGKTRIIGNGGEDQYKPEKPTIIEQLEGMYGAGKTAGKRSGSGENTAKNQSNPFDL